MPLYKNISLNHWRVEQKRESLTPQAICSNSFLGYWWESLRSEHQTYPQTDVSEHSLQGKLDSTIFIYFFKSAVSPHLIMTD